MKIFNRTGRRALTSLAIAVLILTGFSVRSLANPASRTSAALSSEKHVQIKVEIHGDVDGISEETIEHLMAEWLEAAHFIVSETDGADYLHLHIKLEVTDNHHFKVHSDCADWHEDKEAAVADAINEILHHMINDFIDKYSH